MSGKIIIAGATGYTGAALATSFAKDGIQCHLIGRNEEELKKLAASLSYTVKFDWFKVTAECKKES